jgi:alkanesulfonate monooxygenase
MLTRYTTFWGLDFSLALLRPLRPRVFCRSLSGFTFCANRTSVNYRIASLVDTDGPYNRRRESMAAAEISIFSTCPQSRGLNAGERAGYLKQVVDVAGWSERAGCRGMLIYTDNALVDPWLIAQLVMQNTERLCPLVAVQPLYMHPYTVAKMVTSLGFLHGRQVYLNMVAGGFVNDLKMLADDAEHDERYRRLVEYTMIVKELLANDGAYSFSGDYYTVRNLSLRPTLPPHLMPPIFVSGSSTAGLAAARALNATAVKYPRPSVDEASADNRDSAPLGMRIGIFARPTRDAAWHGALARFPADRKGQLTHKLAMRLSDSRWHEQLSKLGQLEYSDEHPYWLGPFENYKTFCPYLVGSYERVGHELRRYVALGFQTFILDIPAAEHDLLHSSLAFEAALRSPDARASDAALRDGSYHSGNASVLGADAPRQSPAPNRRRDASTPGPTYE